MSKKKTIIIIIIALIILIAAIFAWQTYIRVSQVFKSLETPPQPSFQSPAETIPETNPFKQVKVNPLEEVKTNPFQDVYKNPFGE